MVQGAALAVMSWARVQLGSARIKFRRPGFDARDTYRWQG